MHTPHCDAGLCAFATLLGSSLVSSATANLYYGMASPVSDFYPGEFNSNPAHFTSIGSSLFFGVDRPDGRALVQIESKGRTGEAKDEDPSVAISKSHNIFSRDIRQGAASKDEDITVYPMEGTGIMNYLQGNVFQVAPYQSKNATMVLSNGGVFQLDLETHIVSTVLENVSSFTSGSPVGAHMYVEHGDQLFLWAVEDVMPITTA